MLATPRTPPFFFFYFLSVALFSLSSLSSCASGAFARLPLHSHISPLTWQLFCPCDRCSAWQMRTWPCPTWQRGSAIIEGLNAGLHRDLRSRRTLAGALHSTACFFPFLFFFFLNHIRSNPLNSILFLFPRSVPKSILQHLIWLVPAYRPQWVSGSCGSSAWLGLTGLPRSAVVPLPGSQLPPDPQVSWGGGGREDASGVRRRVNMPASVSQ